MKKTFLILALVIVGLTVLFFVKPADINNVSKKVQNPMLIPRLGGLEFSLPFSDSSRDAAWALFQKYLGYNKARDLEGVKSVVYKVAPVCEDVQTRVDCDARMGLAYMYGSALKKEDLKNVWDDKKQIILSGDFVLTDTDGALSRTRAIIFFIYDTDGQLKLLSFSPAKGVVIDKGSASKEELNERILIYTEDTDRDGAPDYHEQCLDVPNDPTCVETNPKLRDTDGDGLWDGVQALMK